MYQLRVKDHFDAAHYIKDYGGKCQRMHGHRWDVEVALEGASLDTLNMLVDFALVKSDIGLVLDGLDHYILNERLGEPNVTAEFLAKCLFIALQARFSLTLEGRSTVLKIARVSLKSVTVWESPDCCAVYSEEG